MDIFVLAMLLAFGFYVLRTREERRRIQLLGSHLGKYQIEKLMETLTDGYLRALGEADSQRRGQIFQLLETSETALAEQFSRFAADFAKVDAAQARASTLALSLPFASTLFSGATFDMREALRLHARGIAHAAANSDGRSAKDKAFVMSAELFLMQHSCHWFCKGLAVASARTLVRHKTPHAQLVASVGPATRQAYTALTRVAAG